MIGDYRRPSFERNKARILSGVGWVGTDINDVSKEHIKEHTKEDTKCLYKEDKSLKGSVDEPMIEIFNLINNNPSYVTTSCCSGRITLYNSGVNNIKKDGRLLFVSHDPVDEQQLIKLKTSLLTRDIHYDSKCPKSENEKKKDEKINEKKDEKKDELLLGDVTLKYEPLLIHVECDTLLSGRKLLSIAYQCGLKNSGANSFDNNRIVIAIRGTLRVDVPIVSFGTQIIPSDLLPSLVHVCNLKLNKNLIILNKLTNSVRSHFYSAASPGLNVDTHTHTKLQREIFTHTHTPTDYSPQPLEWKSLHTHTQVDNTHTHR
eukprot:GHVR01165957.1.p1 GENE.GHVR01165957.1~~GHVR01165957.1.p1  ORF type:complete len:317 (-),score=117.48 GHVR01165957.1:27-977(-)